MSAETKQKLETFAQNADWREVALPADMERFWDFVISAYRNRDYTISIEEFLDVINAVGPEAPDTTQKKRRLAGKLFMHGKYLDGIALLRKFEEL